MLTRQRRTAPVTSGFLQPVYGETVREVIIRRLQELVRAGRLRPGERLPSEPELARMLHVSRNSLREALKGLAFLGAIRARPGDGTFISAIPSEVMARHFRWVVLLNRIDYLELFWLRKIMEGTAATEAARRASPDNVEKMRKALESARGKLD